jgi:DNA adenine methylase
MLRLTPFSRTEFDECYLPAADPVEAARRLVIRSYMGFGSNAHATTGTKRAQTGFRANSSRSGRTPSRDWANYPDCLGLIIERLAGITVERRPAVAVMAAHDGEATLHYVDPPYPLGLRNPGNPYDRKHMYRHEMSDDDHAELLIFLTTLIGMVVLSGYASPLYDDALAGWKRVETAAFADGARPRTEVLWINPAAAEALDHHHRAGTLFAEARL